MFRTILVGYDGSAGSVAALHRALQLARDYHGTLHLLSVAEPLPHYLSSRHEAGQEESEAARHFQAVQAQARRMAAGSDVEVVTRTARGHAARAIVDAAREIGADLIVLGQHGHSGVLERVLGSTSDRVLDAAPCSVLVVREGTSGGS
jgi:nucleotide-binding universal stress UspA family protein